MTEFKSKVDSWFYAVMALVALVLAIALVDVLRTEQGPGMWVALAVIAMTGVSIPWLLLSTRYRIDERYLYISCGPARWKISRDEIHSVKTSRNPLSSPALSLDRLAISYGDNKRIMISPADRSRFLHALGLELDQ